MIKKTKQLFYTFISTILIFFPLLPVHNHLSEITWSAAGVLPTFIDYDDIKKVILTREKSGKDKGTYDDFGGASETYDKHPLFSAAREFWEEALLQKTIGFSPKKVRTYIDLAKTNNTEYIIAVLKKDGTYGVTYITNFTGYADQLLTNFYDALNYYQTKKSKKYKKFLEKDRIATVTWDSLINAIAQSEKTSFIDIEAMVIDPENGKHQAEIIQLRPWLVSKLQLFAQNKPYEEGAHNKIRFYSWEYKNIICGSQESAKNKQ